MRTHFEIDYRARATQAEQENARLREELAKKPNFKWFLDQVYDMLKIPKSAPVNDVVQKIKTLRDNQELYRSDAAKDRRREEKQAENKIFTEGRKCGIMESVEALRKLHGETK